MIADFIGRRAELSPQRRAVWADGRWYTCEALNRRALRLAARLGELGVRPGDRVGILALNHIAHIDLMLAAPKLGFIHAPFNHRLAPSELQALAAYVEPRLMLFASDHADAASALGCESRSLTGYEAWLESAGDPPPVPVLSPDDTHMMLFTGGTTGVPKAAMLPYRQIFTNAVNTVFSWGLTPEDCAIQATPCFHAAVNVLTTPLLYLGGRVVLQSAFEPGEFLALASQHRATLLFLVPAMYQMLAEQTDFAAADLNSVRWAISGGAPCPAPVREAFAAKGVPFKQGYGLTEAGVNCFSIEIDEARAKPQAVGRPVLLAHAILRDAAGEPVPDGEVGELTLAGPHVFKGYFRRPRATAEALRDGWLWTGDLAYRDASGCYTITGRRKEMFISGGENVYPLEVETALYALPGIAECAVVGVPDSRWGEAGLAAVRLQPGTEMSAGALREALRPWLASFKIPRHVLFLDALPKSGAGKILKSALRQEFQHRTSDRR